MPFESIDYRDQNEESGLMTSMNARDNLKDRYVYFESIGNGMRCRNNLKDHR